MLVLNYLQFNYKYYFDDWFELYMRLGLLAVIWLWIKKNLSCIFIQAKIMFGQKKKKLGKYMYIFFSNYPRYACAIWTTLATSVKAAKRLKKYVFELYSRV